MCWDIGYLAVTLERDGQTDRQTEGREGETDSQIDKQIERERRRAIVILNSPCKYCNRTEISTLDRILSWTDSPNLKPSCIKFNMEE